MSKKLPKLHVLEDSDVEKLKTALAGSAAFERVDPKKVPLELPDRLPGFTDAFISRSFDETQLTETLKFGGKFVLTRFAQNRHKNYAYGFAFSGSGEVVFWDYPKDKSYHHEPSGSNPSAEKVADRANLPDV